MPTLNRPSPSVALTHFFAVERRNEDAGGVRPATLGSAMNSFGQADDDTLRQWCAPAGAWRTLPATTLPVLDRQILEAELGLLIADYGADTPLNWFPSPG